ncbi:hypothetical protein [Blattabacterium cuenoti]|uniref:hypothetical protein n=1 Tax=Blattabacterium cuenoti TaxID=1653831 RepID=UPI00312036BC
MMEGEHNKIKKIKLNQKYNSILNHSINPDLTSQHKINLIHGKQSYENELVVFLHKS